MLIISLFAHFQHCVERYRTRKALAALTSAQMRDMGMTEQVRQAELSQASLWGISRDLMTVPRKTGDGS